MVLHWIRRGHLYLGLFLFPWAMLYGFTGFLFNHPLIMSDQPLETFGREVWQGTPMEAIPDLDVTAGQVIESIREQHGTAAADMKRVIGQPARYANDFAFATVKNAEGDIGLLFDVPGGGGTIRRTAAAKPADIEEAFPWAVGPAPPQAKGNLAIAVGDENPASIFDSLVLENSLADRLKDSIPAMLRDRKMPTGEVKITSVPDLTFVVETQGRQWKVSYNALKGTVTGKPFHAADQTISWRRFLTRLHVTHGYPSSSTSTKWFWVIGADTLALVMIYWGGSGLLMWWQIKSSRHWGLAVLTLSSLVASLLAVNMHQLLSAG